MKRMDGLALGLEIPSVLSPYFKDLEYVCFIKAI